jgi:hypothetical protein
MAAIDPNRLVNLGAYANDGTGDDLRRAFEKVNSVLSELYVDMGVSNARNIGTGTDGVPADGQVGIFKDKNGVNLEFKTLTSTDGTVSITASNNTVDLTALTTLARDPNPTLNHNLNLNGHTIIGDFNGVLGGQIEARVWNYDVKVLASMVELLARTSGVDFGGDNFQATKTSWPTDFGSGDAFTSPYANSLDFGTF